MLLGKQERKALLVRQPGPAGPLIVPARRLGAAVKHDHERCARRKRWGQVDTGLEIAGVGTETGQLLQAATAGVRRKGGCPTLQCGQASDGVVKVANCANS